MSEEHLEIITLLKRIERLLLSIGTIIIWSCTTALFVFAINELSSRDDVLATFASFSLPFVWLIGTTWLIVKFKE